MKKNINYDKLNTEFNELSDLICKVNIKVKLIFNMFKIISNDKIKTSSNTSKVKELKNYKKLNRIKRNTKNKLSNHAKDIPKSQNLLELKKNYTSNDNNNFKVTSECNIINQKDFISKSSCFDNLEYEKNYKYETFDYLTFNNKMDGIISNSRDNKTKHTTSSNLINSFKDSNKEHYNYRSNYIEKNKIDNKDNKTNYFNTSLDHKNIELDLMDAFEEIEKNNSNEFKNISENYSKNSSFSSYNSNIIKNINLNETTKDKIEIINFNNYDYSKFNNNKNYATINSFSNNLNFKRNKIINKNKFI